MLLLSGPHAYLGEAPSNKGVPPKQGSLQTRASKRRLPPNKGLLVSKQGLLLTQAPLWLRRIGWRLANSGTTFLCVCNDHDFVYFVVGGPEDMGALEYQCIIY